MLAGHCICLDGLICKAEDFSLMEALAEELTRAAKTRNEDGGGIVSWSKHLKHENPQFSPTFLKVIKLFETYFDMDIFATRLNFYRNGADWKPFHHDSHAYGEGRVKEDFTVGASLGASRALAWRHTKDTTSDGEFAFPQRNGDVFAFDSVVNDSFKHGVPRGRTSCGPRFSIIAWGRRRTINERNGGKIGSAPIDNRIRAKERFERKEDGRSDHVRSSTNAENVMMNGVKALTIKSRTAPKSRERTNESIDIDVLSMVREFVQSKSRKKDRDAATFASKNKTLLKRLKRMLPSNQLKAFKSCAKAYRSKTIDAETFVSQSVREIGVPIELFKQATIILPCDEQRRAVLAVLAQMGA